MVNDAGVIVFPGFPAVDMYEFRLYTFATQLIVWTTIGLVFATSISKVWTASDRATAEAAQHVSEIVRLTLVSHAMTDAMAAGRFPRDEALNALGQRQVDATVDLGVVDAAVCGPETRTRQTAELLGLRAETEPLLADLNCGAWRGSVLGGVGTCRVDAVADRSHAGAARRRVGGRPRLPASAAGWIRCRIAGVGWSR